MTSSIKIDAHHHIWNPSRGDYPWMDSAPEILQSTFGPSEFTKETKGSGISKSIMVQAAPTLAESEYMIEQAENMPEVAAIVGWVNLNSSNASVSIERLFENPLVRGVRPMLQDIKQVDWVLNPTFQSALNALQKLGGVFDVLGQVRHMQAILKFSEMYSDLPIVLNHMMKPNIKDNEFDVWASGISALAKRENVSCKFSGLLTEARVGCDVKTLRPYTEHIFEQFRPNRIMFGSDWPVLLASGCSYAGWCNMVDQLLNGFSHDEQEDVWWKTASGIYQLDLDGVL